MTRNDLADLAGLAVILFLVWAAIFHVRDEALRQIADQVTHHA